MFISSGLQKEYMQVLNCQRWILGKTFEWSESKQELRLLTKPFKITLVVSILFFVLQLNNVVGNRTRNDAGTTNAQSQIGRLIAVMYTVFAILLIHYCCATLMSNGATSKLFAGFACFEKRNCKRLSDLSPEELRMLRSAKKTCSLMRQVGVMSAPVTISLTAVALPKLPLNMLFTPPGKLLMVVLENLLDSTGIYWPILKRFFCFIFNLWFWVLTYGMGIVMTNQIIIGTSCITAAISVFQRRMQGLTGTNISIAEAQQSIKVYREIQLLTSYFNQVHSNLLISMLSTVIISQVVSIHGLLSGDKVVGNSIEDLVIPYVLKWFYINGFILCFTCINFIFDFCGIVNKKSKECLGMMDHKQNLYMNKHVRRLMRSMPEIKIMLGGVNFIEKLTPVVYQQFTNERIIETLLLRSV